MTRRCRFRCELKKGEKLRKHMNTYHPEYYRKVQAWLGATEAKLTSAEILARDGMKGPGGTAGAPGGRSVVDRYSFTKEHGE